MLETASGAGRSLGYRLIYYVPNILGEEKVPIAAIIFESSDHHGRTSRLRVAPDWQKRIRDADRTSDLEMLDAFLREICTRLLSAPKELMAQLEDSLSNTIQISEVQELKSDLSARNFVPFANTSRGRLNLSRF